MQARKLNALKNGYGSAMVVALGLLVATSVQAAPIQVNATEDSVQPGFFTLDFGAKVGIASGQITSTDYGLEVDPDAGTARLTDYYQEVESLNLFGAVPTGDIVVTIVEGSSSGTYNKATREFTTTETYLVYFAEDLSAFGLVSPVELESTSTGTVDISTERGASHVNLTWEGGSDIAGQEFSYDCQVNTQFSATSTQILDIGLKSAVLDLNLAQSIEDQLIGPLDMTSLRLQQRNIGSAARNLSIFIDRVEGFRGNAISVVAANEIIADANYVLKRTKPRYMKR